jgi:hypothetical protein
VSEDQGKGSRTRIVGRLLIVAGVAIWPLYAVFKLFGLTPEMKIILPLHLAGVIPGMLLSHWLRFKSWIHSMRSNG